MDCYSVDFVVWKHLTAGPARCRGGVFGLIVLCTLLNGAGFLWYIFEPVSLYDEIAHVITPFTLVTVTAEIIYRAGGGDEFFDTPRHALVTGSAIGLVGAAGWEGIEILLDYLFPAASIDHALPDTIFDVVLGVFGGAAGAWVADRYQDRLFNRSRSSSRLERVR